VLDLKEDISSPGRDMARFMSVPESLAKVQAPKVQKSIAMKDGMISNALFHRGGS
jgi:hypothetical protein